MSHATKVAQKFASILEGEKDWEKRVVAMQKMEESLKTDFALELTQKDILLFRPGLCNQITDVRTAVAKQACEFTTTLAETHSVGFAPHTQVIVSVLLKGTTTTVKVTSDAAHVALCLMLRIQALPAAKILLEIAKGLKDGHNTALRRRCSLYLLILIKFRFAGLKAVIEDLPATLIALLRDSSPTTRARARAVYMHLAISAPTLAKRVLQEVDAKVKATLTEEITLESADMEGFEPTPPASQAGSRISSRTTSRTTSRSASRSASRSTSPERASKASSSASSISSPAPGSSTASLDLSSLQKKLANLQSARSPLNVPSSSPSSSPSGIARSGSSSNVAGSKSFVRGSPSVTPTKPSVTVTASASATKSSAPSSRTPTSATSRAKTVSSAPSTAAASKKTVSKTPSAPAHKEEHEDAPVTPRPNVNAVSSTVSSPYVPYSSASQDAEFAAAFNSATRESGLKFSGDWRIALRDLRELIHLTRDVLLDLPAAAPKEGHSRIPVSPRSQTQQDAHAAATADAISEEVEEGADMEVVPEDENIEEGWNEVEGEADYELPPEDEESVVV